MAWDTYKDPDNFQIGSQFYGVVSITVSVSQTPIRGSADDDAHESLARYGTKRTDGRITFIDPHEARRAANLSGTITFTWTDVKGSTDLTVTIANASTGGYNATVARDAAATATLEFIAESEPTYA